MKSLNRKTYVFKVTAFSKIEQSSLSSASVWCISNTYTHFTNTDHSISHPFDTETLSNAFGSSFVIGYVARGAGRDATHAHLTKTLHILWIAHRMNLFTGLILSNHTHEESKLYWLKLLNKTCIFFAIVVQLGYARDCKKCNNLSQHIKCYHS